MKFCPLCDKSYGDEVTVCDIDGSLLRDRVSSNTLIGRTIRGRYRVLERLGEGGMAMVYLAEQINVERKVALKVLHGRYSDDQEFVKRFRQEARLAASLNHSSVIQIYDFDQADDGMLFIAMEYLKGKNLKELIQAGAVSVQKAVHFGVQIAQGLAVAHRAGVIHRDVKPENIMALAGEDEIKLMDFGIARLRESGAATRLTRAGMMMGTPLYMAPEQIEGGEVTERTDIYAFGIVLYEMLSGVVPFRAPTPSAVLMKHLKEAPMPLRKMRGEIPASIERIVSQALEKKPGRRPQAMDQVALALQEAETVLMRQTMPKTMVMSRAEAFEESADSAATEAVSQGALAKLRAGLGWGLQKTELSEPKAEVADTANRVDQTAIIENPADNKTVAATVVGSFLDPSPHRSRWRWWWAGLVFGGVAALGGVAAFWMNRPLETKNTPVPNVKNEAAAEIPPAAMKVTSLTIRPEKEDLKVNERMRATVSVKYDDGHQEEINHGVTWQSSNPEVLKIDPSGVVEGKSAGRADLLASYDNIKAPSVPLTVTEETKRNSAVEKNVVAVAIFANRTELNVHERLPLVARGKYSDGREDDLTAVRWESSNPNVIAIDAHGVIAAVRQGRANVIARYQGIRSKPLTILVAAPANLTRPAVAEVKTTPVQDPGKAAAIKDGPTREKEIDAALKSANGHLDKGEYSEASAVLEKIQKIDPGNRKISAAIASARKACNAEKNLGRTDLKC